ncbi:sushi, von Willebrand factor type A, EGF and pentraxin domain-containing protein 1-like isoform X2 [Centruroides sculpturatus]|uniref:sushi, von Willebrand factor type A, EGF and pentraxin domain-containing protein 1-like isoform X2 n=1 Tax=Centruroides sculpturatus TaxID=218467 RepID=UPI000C6DA4D5|nr:sushi, von Willebrand factor type A, EGF and pentraxin domain-containing protein 1-like isoform X2 [Centruroides sculpturatus]
MCLRHSWRATLATNTNSNTRAADFELNGSHVAMSPRAAFYVMVLLFDSMITAAESEEETTFETDNCTRSRGEANLKGRKCLRKCRTDLDCISSRKRCLCDGLCGWSCVRPDLHCEELPQPENGQVKVTGDHFGARAVYTCDEDYYISGPKDRVCQGDGTWSDHEPICKEKGLHWPKMCGIPPQVTHARHSAQLDKEEFDVDAMVQFNCFHGYDAKGFARAKCILYNGTAQWFGPDLECIPRSCAPPKDIQFGRREGDVFTFTSRVTYVCIEGYELIGRPNRYCQSNGQWSGVLPSCRPVVCPIPTDPVNGRASYSSVTYNSIVEYQCSHGYRLVGPKTRRCQADKKWEGDDPLCEEISCGSPGILYNGYLEGRSTTLGSIFTVNCFDGMKMEGNPESIRCQENGTWSHPLPKCLAPCIVPVVENGTVVEVVPGSRVTHGQQIMVECRLKYELIYNATPATCNNGTWTHVPVCVPARCKLLPESPKNGMVIAPKTDHGMKALYKCRDGYKLKGPNITECDYGQWTGETPGCAVVYCPYPGELAHGKVLLIGHMGMYEYRSYVRKVGNDRQIMYECHRHYTLIDGPTGATCVDGQWSPREMPRCVRGSHPSVRWIRSARRKREIIKNRMRSRRRRGKNKERRPKEPCSSLPEVPWMEVEVVKLGKGNYSLPHGTVISVTCSRGHQLNIGNKTARCVRGRWKPREPECLPSSCLANKLQSGVYHHFQMTVDEYKPIPHGEQVTIICLPGFQLMGPESLRCWYGEWAVDNYPECIPRPCELPVIPDGNYLSGYRAGLTISHGSSVDYECKPNYVKPTEEPVRCSEGQLRPEPPACHHYSILINAAGFGDGRRPCQSPERLQNTLIYPAIRSLPPSVTLRDQEEIDSSQLIGENEKTQPHGTEVRFKCITGITGEKTTWKIVCQDGDWVGGTYKCEAEQETIPLEERKNKSCIYRNSEPHLVAFQGDRKITEEFSEFPPFTELIFRCRDIGKFSLRGSIRRRCENGEWDGVKPSCFGLSQENDYALEKPPTILFRHQLGPIAQSNDGKLIVYPGTILHLECLWIRKYGQPKWEISHSYRKYPEGWTNEPGRDPQLEYRLSIYHAQKDDSGRFNCITPMGHSHGVDIVVSAVHCPPLTEVPGLHISNPSTKMETKVIFSCKNGQSLIGSEQATCLPSGNWSAPPPTCRVTQCRDITNETDPLITIELSGLEVGAKAVFSCPKGYGLRGEGELICLDTGQWSSAVPRCEEVSCVPPDTPEHGYLQDSSRDHYGGGALLQFACNTGYMIDGTPIIVCQESGRWSAPVPKCVPACTYPGTTTGATISNVKFYYSINETVTFDCADGYELRGAKMLRCLEDGRWSSTIPTCHIARKG